ncbi:MAG: PA2778 family cysteine peptidase [Porticoccaceae bacterium]
MLPTYLPDGPARAVELSATPFFPQEEYQCGPAALATVLAAADASATPDELAPLVYLPARKGSLQPELVATVRRYQRLPYVIDTDFSALLAEVTGGRPVLVLQNLGVSWYPIWHYAVVVGYQPGTDQLLLRSGTTKRQPVGTRRFLNSWARAGNWGLVVLKPGELPAHADADRYLQAVAALESASHYAAALSAYQAAFARWPTDTRTRFGVANSLLGLGRANEAIHHYRQLLASQPDNAAALNNLAEALAATGCREQAITTIERAIAVPGLPPTLAPVLQKTRAELMQGTTSGTARNNPRNDAHRTNCPAP